MLCRLFSSYDVAGLLVSLFAFGSTHALALVWDLNQFNLSYTYHHHHLVSPRLAIVYPVYCLLHYLHYELGELVGPLHPILCAVVLPVSCTIPLAIGG